MDRIHLPAIVELRAPFESGRGLVKNDLTTEEVATRSTNRTRRKGAKDKTGLNLDQDTTITRKKIGILADKQRRLNTKFTVSGGKIKTNSRSEGKQQNARRRSEAAAAVGLPNISLSVGGSVSRTDNSNADRTGAAKKAKRCRVSHNGDTISYVYSKSLKDENCMAFLRNRMESVEKGVTSEPRLSASVIDKKKPYGLPSLKANMECVDRREWITTSQDSLANGDSLLNRWEVDDDDAVSNGTNYDSSDS